MVFSTVGCYPTGATTNDEQWSRMREAELRAEWKKVVSTDDEDVLERVWKELDEAGYVAEALNEPEAGLQDLVDDTEMRLKYWRLGQGRTKSPGRGQKADFTPQFGQREIERAAAIEEYAAKIATTDPDVYTFREKILGGRLLPEEQARAFVTSPATRFLEYSQFEGLGILPLEHNAELRDYTRKRVMGKVRYSSIVSFQGLAVETPVRPVPDTKGHLPRLYYVGEDGYVKSVEASLGSVIYELREIGAQLSERYSWQEAQATWFVLTGIIPAVQPVRTAYQAKRSRHFNHGEIILTVAPWVPADVVRNVYRKAQRKVLGGDNQPLREKNLKLMRFVTERIDPLGGLQDRRREKGWDWRDAEEEVPWLEYETMPSGKELVEEWDSQEWVQENPEERAYRGDTRRFWRDYGRVRRAVAHHQSKLDRNSQD